MGARRYSFKDDDGERVEGAKLFYVTLEAEDEPDSRGEIPMELSGPLALFDQLKALPGFYDLDFRHRPGRGGRPTLQLAGVEYQEPALLVPDVTDNVPTER